LNNITKTKEGKYITIPDGDDATQSQIIRYEIEKERRYWARREEEHRMASEPENPYCGWD